MKALFLFSTLFFAFAVGCGATEADVREICKGHDGVRSVTGNAVRKYVTCNDGYYKTVT